MNVSPEAFTNIQYFKHSVMRYNNFYLQKYIQKLKKKVNL